MKILVRRLAWITPSLLLGCQDPCLETGALCTIAGQGLAAYGGDGGPALKGYFYDPMDVIARPGTSELIVTDFNNHRLRRIKEDGTLETIVGDVLPGDGDAPNFTDREAPGAAGTTVALNHPVQAEFDPTTGLLVIPCWHNHKVRTWDPATGLVIVSAGDSGFDDGNGANAGFSGDGGPADDALMFFPNSVAFGADGSLYLVDQRNLRLRHIDAAETITTVAGDGTWGGGGDGGPAVAASFAFIDALTNLQPEPGGAVEADGDGRLYLADTFNHRIRRFDPATGGVETIAGTGEAGYGGDGGQALNAKLNAPRDLEFGPDGRLYVADTNNAVIRAIDLADGSIETVVGVGQSGLLEEGAPATATMISRAFGIDFGEDGALLIADTYNNRILRVTP